METSGMYRLVSSVENGLPKFDLEFVTDESSFRLATVESKMASREYLEGGPFGTVLAVGSFGYELRVSPREGSEYVFGFTSVKDSIDSLALFAAQEFLDKKKLKGVKISVF